MHSYSDNQWQPSILHLKLTMKALCIVLLNMLFTFDVKFNEIFIYLINDDVPIDTNRVISLPFRVNEMPQSKTNKWHIEERPSEHLNGRA